MICLLRYGVWRTEVFVILGHFIALLPHKQHRILKKWKKCLEILSIYTCVPWIKIIWCMVPEIWSMTDRIFCHFCHHKWQSRCMAPVIWRATDIIFCHFGPFFCPFTPLIGWKIKILKKKLKTLEISCNTCVPYLIVPEIWSTTDRIFLVILGHFLSYPPNNLENQNFEKMKTNGDIILHKCSKNRDHMLYCSWDMAFDGCKFYFSFWAIFYTFTPLTTRKIKVSKKQKKHLEISFYMFSQKLWSHDVCFMRYGALRTGRWTKRTVVQKKWHAEVGAPPNNRNKSHNLFWVPKAAISLSFVSIWPFDTTVN